MKTLLVSLILFAGLESTIAQNIDSLFYQGLDTTGLAKEIALEEADWTPADTLAEADYDRVDDQVLAMNKKYKNIPELASDINQMFGTDEEKVRAIFRWLTINIVYDYVAYANHTSGLGSVTYTKKTSKTELDEKWEKIYFDYATRVLRNKRGVCEGYATLFYELCRMTNVKCEMVTGYAGDDMEKIGKYKKQKQFPTNHAWNRVYLNDEWLYLDVTWASGGTYTGKRTETTSYNPTYYLVSASKLYPDHVTNEKQTKQRNEIVGNYKN